MTDQYADSSTGSRVARMVTAIDDSATLGDWHEIERGGNRVYRVTIETAAGTREQILKVSGDGGGDLSAEARLLRLLDAETELPVPGVSGIVGDHPDLPTPFFLMEYVDGEHLPGDPDELPLETSTSLAREVGRYLGELHSLDAFDGFGPIIAARDLRPAQPGGAGPLAREYGLTIPDPSPSWPARLDLTVESMCERHRESRFGDRTPEMREAIEELRARVDLESAPAIARIDHSLHNIVVDADRRSIRGILDWGLVRTTSPEYELVCAEQGFCGTASLESERRSRVRNALYDGYRENEVISEDEGFETRRRLYFLVYQLATMTWVSGWVTPDVAEHVERDHRRFVDELVTG